MSEFIAENITTEDTRKVLTFDEMMKLHDNTENFDYVDEIINNVRTRSFNYRLDIFSSFAQIGARNFRGTVYNIDTKELLGLPFFKFFNYNQSPFTLDNIVKKWKISSIYEKVDGSMIFFYRINGKLICRTQRRCDNIQSIRALQIVNNNDDLKNYINHIIDEGYTPIFELLSPQYDPHIIKYKFETLCLLAIRNMNTGKIHMADMEILPTHESNLISVFPIYYDKIITINDIVEECMNKIFERDELLEGYVVLFDNNELVKFKRSQFISIQKIRDNILNDSNVVEMLLNGILDDVISEFQDDKEIMDYINMIINCVNNTYNTRINICEQFYRDNKQLSRKDYALKAKINLDKMAFSIAMELYSCGFNIDYSKIKRSYINSKEWQSYKDFTEIKEN